MPFVIFLFAALTAVGYQIQFVHGFDYCSINCNGASHTLCDHKKGSGKCAGLLSNDEKLVLLEAHNRLRKDVALGNNTGQPTASNMRAVSWDQEAAEIAQRWADTCPKGHDRCRVLSNGDYVGQNQAFMGSSVTLDRKKTLANMVQMWYDEIKYVDPNSIGSFPPQSSGQVIGHYTQVVWAETERIGCGMGTTNNGVMNEYYLICNYYPGGNINTRPVYKVGKECSECDKGTTCSKKWPGLCSTDDDEKGEILPMSGSKSSFSKSTFSILIYCLFSAFTL